MSTPHDALFKYVFSQPEHAAAVLRALLPAEISARLDWSSLTPLPASFVDEHLAGRHADLLFSVLCGRQRVLLYLLFEHQSRSDALMPFRSLRYVVRIWDSFLAAHPDARLLPAVVPVVLFHGDSPWMAPTDLSDLFDLQPEMRAAIGSYLPAFRFLLDDITELDDASLRDRSLSAVATAALLLLRSARQSPDLLADLRRWRDLLLAVAAAPNGLSAFAALLEYTLRVGEVATDDLRRFVHELGPGPEEAFVTTYQQIAQQAEARGRAAGKAEGKAEGKSELVLRLLAVRFGPLPAAVVQRVRDAAPSTLDGWAELLMTAESLDDVLR